MIAHSPPTDRELLAAFVKTADGSAFAALTERHLGLVFGVACGRTGSREMAQEAAQNTFCQLARHAPRLTVGISLGPWLHAVALREAGTLLRAEAARLRALERLADSARPGAAAYSSASPSSPPPGSEHLDEALAALPEAARRVLVLRYLQGLSLREVAIEEDTSEEAARKRVTRALDRLTRSLARRGVTAAGVTACLAAAPGLWPAPSSAASLAARALQQAAAPAAGAGLSGLAGFALSQWPVAAVFLLAAVPAAWPWGATANGRAGNDLPGRMSSAVSADSDLARADKPLPPGEPPIITGLKSELRRFHEGGWQRQDMTRSSGGLISRIGFEEWRVDPARIAAVRAAVLDFTLEEVQAAAALPDGDTAGLIVDVLYSRWAELEPEAAPRAALAHAERSKSQAALLGVLSVRALSDPAGAALWAWEHAPENLEEHSPGEGRKELLTKLLEPMLAADPQAYLRLMTSPPLDTGTLQSRDFTFAVALPYAPAAALEGLLAEEKRGPLPPSFAFRKFMDLETLPPADAEVMASFAGDLPADSTLRGECMQAASRVLARSEPARAADLMVSARPANPEKEEAWVSKTGDLLRDWTGTDPAAAARWLSAKMNTNTETELDPDAVSDLARLAGLPALSLIVPNPPTAP